ncbi:MAG: hypothetical protein WC441_05160 [Patescibacteria group bacterium]
MATKKKSDGKTKIFLAWHDDSEVASFDSEEEAKNFLLDEFGEEGGSEASDSFEDDWALFTAGLVIIEGKELKLSHTKPVPPKISFLRK